MIIQYTQTIKDLLEAHVEVFNTPAFIESDPISIPHTFTKPQDIEIAAFWAAMLAWGRRSTVIKKCKKLLEIMDYAPYEFTLHHRPKDLQPLLQFKHRTFNGTDALYFARFLQHHYHTHSSLEPAFTSGLQTEDASVEKALIYFHQYFFSLEEAPSRTRKHIATPQRKAACKRLNMFLRWMVRQDDKGVDFGLWKTIQPSQLVIPCDVHVARVARKIGLLQRSQVDWQAALALTQHLKLLSPLDPTRYDFALFGLGVLGYI